MDSELKSFLPWLGCIPTFRINIGAVPVDHDLAATIAATSMMKSNSNMNPSGSFGLQVQRNQAVSLCLIKSNLTNDLGFQTN